MKSFTIGCRVFWVEWAQKRVDPVGGRIMGVPHFQGWNSTVSDDWLVKAFCPYTHPHQLQLMTKRALRLAKHGFFSWHPSGRTWQADASLLHSPSKKQSGFCCILVRATWPRLEKTCICVGSDCYVLVLWYPQQSWSWEAKLALMKIRFSDARETPQKHSTSSIHFWSLTEAQRVLSMSRNLITDTITYLLPGNSGDNCSQQEHVIAMLGVYWTGEALQPKWVLCFRPLGHLSFRPKMTGWSLFQSLRRKFIRCNYSTSSTYPHDHRCPPALIICNYLSSHQVATPCLVCPDDIPIYPTLGPLTLPTSWWTILACLECFQNSRTSQ